MEENQKLSLWQRMGLGDRVAAIALAVLIVLNIALNILQRAHLSLIHGEVYLFLPLLTVFLLLGWGASALFRRIGNRTVKAVVGILLGLVLFAVVIFGFSYVSFLATITIPQQFTVVKSPAGKRLVVMRRLDTDEDRINARHDRRLEADPEGDPEVTVNDWGYAFSAYPRVAALFYRDDVEREGEVVIGYASDATLMVEWAEEGNQARFYVANPQPEDGGELVVKY